ncbi:MAG: hypothetical protein OXE84_00310 [Rhodobacteraceae bacterium]|nr:hypothetical protein [Paracoccaceae bacterium]MCY4327543.1 hypothetical protein [Paracoccaceae bacterium]
MTDETENARAIAELTGRLDAQRAENEAMESRIDARLASLQTDMAKRDVEAVKRDKDNQRWTITLVLGCTALVIGAVALFS